MAQTPGELYSKLSDAVLSMDEPGAAELARKAVELGYDAYDAIELGLTDGMERAGVLFEKEEYFIPDLLMCSDALYAGLDVLGPHILPQKQKKVHTVVIGVVQGDTHDIGKNLVKIMLATMGFHVIDLGRDIPPAEFVAKAKETGAEIIAVSTLMTTALVTMQEVIRILEREDIRQNYMVVVGGGPVSQAFADQIGADGYAKNAAGAVRLVKSLVEARWLAEKYETGFGEVFE